MSGVRSSTNFPANGFSMTATVATLRRGRFAGRPPSVRISSTTVTSLRMFTIEGSSSASSLGEPMKHEAVQELRVEVRGLLRQQLAPSHHRLELVRRGRCDEEGG